MGPALAQLGDLKHRTAYESVLLALRRAILSGSLAPGAHLVQADLASRFGVSNTPVREAMRQLSSEGLIRSDSYRGAVVISPTREEVCEIYEARLLIEPVVMRKAVEKITAAELERAREVQAEMATVEDVGEWVLLNRQFHGMLIDAAHSPRLASIIAGLEDAATAPVALSIKADLARMIDGNKEHQLILQAVESRDPDLVARRVSAHLLATVRAVDNDASHDGEGPDE